jgi:hypothetical protein
MLAEHFENGATDFGPDVDSYNLCNLSLLVIALPLLQRNQWHGNKCRHNPRRFPARKVFSQKQSGHQHCDGRVKRTDYHGGIQSSCLLCANKEERTRRIEASGKKAEGCIPPLDLVFARPQQHDETYHNERSNT